MKLYIHKQEIWNESQCDKRARMAPKDAWGNRPPKGLINSGSPGRPGYGRTVKYNGGCIRDGEWYEGETIPLPVIPDTFEFVEVPAWGLRIQRKA